MICCECEQEIEDGTVTQKDVIALNKKLLGRRNVRVFCAECMAGYLDISPGELPGMAERFKEDGCKLF